MENTCSNCTTMQKQYVELKSELSALKQCIEFKNEQCIELKNELLILQQKFDNILTHVHRDSVDVPLETMFSDNIDQTPQSVCLAAQTELYNESEATDLLYNIYVTAENNCNTLVDNGYQTENILPYTIIEGHPFSQFSLEELDTDTVFIQQYSNRLTCFYGDYQYSYGNRTHSPIPFPHPDNYIHTILGHLKLVLPNYVYNSVLITKYNSGGDYLGFHSDNEDEIAPGSSIVTISLGATRSVKFQQMDGQATINLQSLEVNHGDIFIMSKESQHLYQHSVPSIDCTGPRISITCRLLNPSHSPSQNILSQAPALVASSAGAVVSTHTDNHNVNVENPQSTTVYISSSMFRGLDEQKLSSSTQQAVVLFYPGATAGEILRKLQADPKFLQIDKGKVSKIFLLCGTNNVDEILNVEPCNYSNFIEHYTMSNNMLIKAKSDIKNLTQFLHQWSETACINIINILPRESGIRNSVINDINSYIKYLSMSSNYITMVGTELNRNLFTFKDGTRKNEYFVPWSLDNVHLNKYGIIRLAKHLKYYAHN